MFCHVTNLHIVQIKFAVFYASMVILLILLAPKSNSV